jgi:SAM-dependent methyltransferase
MIKRGKRLAWKMYAGLRQATRRRARSGARLQSVLRRNANQNGAELHALLVFRYLLHAAAKLERPIGGRILEIGGYGHAGLALVFLLAGAEHYVLNNILPVANRLPARWAENVVALMELGLTPQRSLGEIVEPIAGTGDVRIRRHLIEVLSVTDAARIDLADDSVDLVFSLSVLEHVEDLAAVLATCFRLTRSGGWGFHGIDLRDHANFDRPLEFLRLGEAEFAAKQAGTNRLRWVDHRRALQHAGFAIEYEGFSTPLPTAGTGTTDCFAQLGLPIDAYFSRDIDATDCWVSDEMRRSLAPEFRVYSNTDLSITGYNAGVSKA